MSSGNHRARTKEATGVKELEILCGSRFRRGLVIRLAACLVSSAELLLLLAHGFAATIGPLLCLFARFPCATPHVLFAFLGTSPQHFTGLGA
jgi:hypothetical protein